MRMKTEYLGSGALRILRIMARTLLGLGVKWLAITSGGCVVASVAHYLKVQRKPIEAPIIKPNPKWDSNWDKREVSSMLKPPKKKKDPDQMKQVEEEKLKLIPTARRHIFLIRHGQYEDMRDSDKTMILTALGVEQSDLVGKRLRELKLNYTRLIRSTMTRAIQTSEQILKYFPDIYVENSELLREGDPIPSEPPIGRWKEEFRYYRDGPRIEAAFRRYFHRASPKQKKDSYEIIVCHANVIRYIICRLLQVPPEAWLRFDVHHCSITKATIEPNGNVYISSIGDCGFIPRDKL